MCEPEIRQGMLLVASLAQGSLRPEIMSMSGLPQLKVLEDSH